jgi:hypothetical protein
MKLYQWLLIVVALAMLGLIFIKQVLWTVAALIFIRVVYIAVQKNKIKTCPPELEE